MTLHLRQEPVGGQCVIHFAATSAETKPPGRAAAGVPEEMRRAVVAEAIGTRRRRRGREGRGASRQRGRLVQGGACCASYSWLCNVASWPRDSECETCHYSSLGHGTPIT